MYCRMFLEYRLDAYVQLCEDHHFSCGRSLSGLSLIKRHLSPYTLAHPSHSGSLRLPWSSPSHSGTLGLPWSSPSHSGTLGLPWSTPVTLGPWDFPGPPQSLWVLETSRVQPQSLWDLETSLVHPQSLWDLGTSLVHPQSLWDLGTSLVQPQSLWGLETSLVQPQSLWDLETSLVQPQSLSLRASRMWIFTMAQLADTCLYLPFSSPNDDVHKTTQPSNCPQSIMRSFGA